jgi:hypothetical protein
VAVAILTQLQLALIDYEEATERLVLTRAIAQRHQALLVAIESAATGGKSHGGETLDQELKSLKAWARYLAGYAGVMTAQARIWNTVGREGSAASANAQAVTAGASTAPAQTDTGTQVTTRPCDTQAAP